MPIVKLFSTFNLAPWTARARLAAPLVAPKQPFPQVLADWPQVHKVAVSTAPTCVFFILPARGLSKVCYWGKLNHDGASCIKAAVEALVGTRSSILIAEFDVDVAHHVVGQVVADVEVFNLTILVKFLKHILVEILLE